MKPCDSIETVIIDQTPDLEGLSVTKEKLKSILEKSGEKMSAHPGWVRRTCLR